MSDNNTLIISILAFLLILFGGTAWLLFNYFPKKTLSIAKDLAETLKNTLGLSPQVTINQKIIYRRANEILELAMLEQDFDVEHETSHKWMGSEKRITVRGTYRAKIGFDLQKGFSVEVNRGRLFRRGHIVLQLPHSEVLSVEPLEIQQTKTSKYYLKR